MLTLKTAIGIEIRGADLEFVCLKRRLRGLFVAERMRLERYRALRPAEAGREYRAFLKRQGLKTANAVVSLPRGQALLRLLALPAEAERNLAKVIDYQVDGLHPFEEGGVYYDFAVLRREDSDGGRLQVAVVMMEKKAADEYYEWFSQAGIAVAGFTVSAAAMYAATGAQPGPTVLADFRPGSMEVLGISSAALYSKEVPLAAGADAGGLLERELAFCRAEMRLAPEARPMLALTGEAPAERPHPAGYEPISIERLAPAPETAPGAAFRLGQHFGAYAAARAALNGARGARSFRVNLLPEPKRIYRSPWTHAPTYALAGLLVLLLLALLARGAAQDRLYLRRLNAEIGRLESGVKYVEKLDSQQHKMLDRVMLLNSSKGETGVKLRALAELTRLLPSSVWLQEAEFREDAITIYGQAESAVTLLGTLDDSPYFRNAEFLSAINKNSEGKDVFRIRVRLETLVAPAPGGRP